MTSAGAAAATLPFEYGGGEQVSGEIEKCAGLAGQYYSSGRW